MPHLAKVLLPSLLLCRVPASWAQADPAQVAIGERLFLETRFSQFYFAHSGTNTNATLSEGDPVTTSLVTMAGTIPGPFTGQAMNCRE